MNASTVHKYMRMFGKIGTPFFNYLVLQIELLEWTKAEGWTTMHLFSLLLAVFY